MNLKMDIKLLITILVIATGLGGFYYTTNMRLDNLEAKIEKVNSNDKINDLAKQIKALRRRVKKLENK